MCSTQLISIVSSQSGNDRDCTRSHECTVRHPSYLLTCPTTYEEARRVVKETLLEQFGSELSRVRHMGLSVRSKAAYSLGREIDRASRP